MDEPAMRGEAGVRLSRLVGWGILGQLSYIASQFILLVALARFVSVDEVGHFGYASAIVTPVFFFFSLGLRVNQSTDVLRRYNFCEFLALRTIATVLGYALVVAIAFAALDPAVRAVTLVFGAAKAVETFSDFFYGVFQRVERLQYVARSLALRGFGSAILFTAILAAKGATELAFLAYLLVWTLVAFFVDYLPARQIAAEDEDLGRVRHAAVIELARSSLPLGVGALLSALQGNMPRYVIGWTIGIAALGQFTAVSYAMQASGTITAAIGNSISARLAYYFASGRRRAFFGVFRRFLLILLSGGALGTFASLAVGDWLVEVIFGPNYANLGAVFALCIFSAVLRGCLTILQTGLFASRDFHLSMVLRAYSLGFMFVACLVGAHFGGLIGVSWGIALTFFAHAVVLWAALRRRPFPESEPKELA